MTSVSFLGFDIASTSPVEFLGEKKELITPGVYLAIVTFAMRRFTKDCVNCWYWLLNFTVTGGEFDGRSLPVRFNIVNTKSPIAEEIGRGQMVHYLQCIGRLEPQSETDLCGVPVLITVGTRKNTFTGRNGEEVEGVVNEIVKIEPHMCVAQSDVQSLSQTEPVPF